MAISLPHFTAFSKERIKASKEHSYNKGDYEGSEQQGGPPYMGITSGVITLGTIAVYSIVNFPTVRAPSL
ncbi:unnamed protein product [Boreogadus saida]